MQIKWSVLCTATVGNWFLILSSIFKRDRSGLKWRIVVIFWQELTSPHFPAWIEYKFRGPFLKLILNHATFLTQTRCCKRLTAMSLESARANCFSAFRQFLPSQVCLTNCRKSPSFLSYSIGVKNVPLELLLPTNYVAFIFKARTNVRIINTLNEFEEFCIY